MNPLPPEPLPLHWASRIHGFLGRVFIAPNEAVGMPAHFYHLQPDRPLPQVSGLDSRYERNAIAVDFVRRELMQRMGPLAVAMSVTLCIAMIVVFRGLLFVLS